MRECHDQRPFVPREDRRRTVLPARMRCGAGWSDVCILNVSSRGLLVYSKALALPGSTIELRRGGQMVVARVVWRNNQRLGLCSDHQLDVEDIISDATAAAAVPAIVGSVQAERRNRPRDPERSRHLSRTIEFLSVMLAGIVLAGFTGTTVYEAIAAPMSAVKQSLSGR